MKPLHFLAFAVSSLSLVACTDVDTVYVGTTDLKDRCAIEPGSNVCDRQFVLRSGDDIGPIRDDLQVLSDFAGLAGQMVRDLIGACRGIVAETSGARIALRSDATLEDELRASCDAAGEAVRRAEPDALLLTITSASCTSEVSVRPCSAPVSAPSGSCSTPTVTVTTSPGAAAETVAIAAALQRHLGSVFAVKARLESAAAFARRVSQASFVAAPDECMSSITSLAASSVERLGAVVSETGSLIALLNHQ